MSFTIEKLQDIEEHLKSHPTLTEGGLPGPVDGAIFTELGSTTIFIQNYQINKPTPTCIIGISSSPTSQAMSSQHGQPSTTKREVKNKRKLNQKKRPKQMMTLIPLPMMTHQQKNLRNLLQSLQLSQRQKLLLNQSLCSTLRSTTWKLLILTS